MSATTEENFVIYIMRNSLVASPLYSLSMLEFQESLCFSLSLSHRYCYECDARFSHTDVIKIKKRVVVGEQDEGPRERRVKKEKYIRRWSFLSAVHDCFAESD